MRPRTVTATAALLAVAGLASPVAAQPPATGDPASAAVITVDLAAAVDLALARNPALGAVEERRREVEGGVEEVRADAFPQLSALASYGASRNPAFLNSPDFEDLLDQFPEGSFEPSEQRLWSTGVEFSQPIYTFGKLSAAIDLAEVVVDVTEAQIDAARLDVALEAALAYYEVLDARQSLVVGTLQERVRRESLEVVRARYDLGEATRLELLRAEAGLAEVTPAIAALEGEVETAESRLRRILGLEAGEVLVVEGALPPELPVDPLAEGVARDLTRAATAGVLGGLPALDGPADAPPFEALAATALARRPELADLELQQRVLVLRQRVTAAGGKPQVEVDGFVGRQARMFENVSDPLYDDYRISLGVNWSFFDGGRRRGQIAQLESQRRQLELARRDLAAGIRLEVEQALIDYRTAVARFRAAAVASAASREAARVARESYEEGVALLTDWLDAQRQEAESGILAVEAYYDARQEAARLARAVGALPSERLPAVVVPTAGGTADVEERMR